MSLMCYPSYQHLFSTDHTSTHTVNTVYKFYKYCRTHLAKFDLFCFKDADVRTQLADGWSLRTDKWTGNATTFKTCSKNSQNISKHIQRFSSTEVSWFSFHFKIQACHIWVHCRSLIGKVGQFVTTVRCTEATEATANAKIGSKIFSQLPRSSCSRWQWGTYHWRTGSVRHCAERTSPNAGSLQWFGIISKN